MKSRFYTAQEVAEMLGVHQSTAYKIINLFMHYLAHCKKNEERIGERFEKGIHKEYIEILEKLCDEVKKIDARYPKLETETDFNNFSMIYSEIINLVSDEIN